VLGNARPLVSILRVVLEKNFFFFK